MGNFPKQKQENFIALFIKEIEFLIKNNSRKIARPT